MYIDELRYNQDRKQKQELFLMYFPTANEYRSVSIESSYDVKYIRIYQSDWEILSKLPELDCDASGLSYKSYNSGYARLSHRNMQTDEYWQQLKSWLEFKLN